MRALRAEVRTKCDARATWTCTLITLPPPANAPRKVGLARILKRVGHFHDHVLDCLVVAHFDLAATVHTCLTSLAEYFTMLFNPLLCLAASVLLSTSVASPLYKRQQIEPCGDASSCAVYSGTSLWFETKIGASCPTVTPPASVDLPAVSQRSNPESCYYPSLDFCAMGQAPLMTAMSSIATAIYNAQPSGAVICGATKTANLVIVTPAAPGM